MTPRYGQKEIRSKRNTPQGLKGLAVYLYKGTGATPDVQVRVWAYRIRRRAP